MVVFLTMPATFLAFAIALAIVAFTERSIRATRWASAGFLFASVAMVSDMLRAVDNVPLGYFAILCHFTSLSCMLQAFAVRHGRNLSLAVPLVAGMAALILLPGSPWTPSFSYRPVVVHLAGFTIIWLALRTLWPSRVKSRIDRAIYFTVFASAAVYFLRAILPIVDPITLASLSNRLIDDEYVVLSHVSSAVLGLAAAILLLLAVGKDLISSKAIESRTDQLTGVGNRRAMELAMEFSARGKKPVGGVIAIDLDHFKQVNDRYGHACGDLLLSAVGKCLSREFRDHATVCRVGGEEFLLLVDREHAGNLALMSERARLAIRSIRLPAPLDDYQPTASVGFREHDPDDDLEITMRAADRAVYRAKAAGRDRVLAAPADA